MPDFFVSLLQGPLEDYRMFLADSWLTLAAGLLAPLLVVFSAAMSSSIAEMRGRSASLHFFLGLCVPVAYPVAIRLFMTVRTPPPSKDAAGEKDAEGAPIDGPPPPTAEAGALESLLTEQMLAENTAVCDREFFESIYKDEEGNFRGPFLLLVGGEQIRAERISDLLERVLVIETLSAAGQTQTLRVPYVNVESCTEAI